MGLVQKKFFITGFPRSGTTYLSVILNSQKNILCIESALESLNNLDIINNKKNFNIVCSIFEHEFAMYGFKPPDFRECNKLEEIKSLFYIELSNIFNVNIIGVKNTRRSLSEILKLTRDGIKVIIVKRRHEDVIRSNINKFIDLNLFDVSLKLKEYNEDLNNYNLSMYKDILVVDYSEMINSKDKIFLKLSNFLEEDIFEPNTLYYSWNKNNGQFYNNSSFRLNDNSKKNEYDEAKILKYANFARGQRYYDLMAISLLKKIKKKIGALI